MATLFILIGPSGVGKTTLKQRLLAQHPDLVESRGVITRPYRPGESHDNDSISVDEFHQRRFRGDLTAVNEVHGNWYGTPIRNLTDPLDEGCDVITIFTADGADTAKMDLPGYPIATIFLAASISTLRERLTLRGDKDVDRRLQTAERELDRCFDFDHFVIASSPLDAVFNRVDAIISKRLFKGGWDCGKRKT